jgi:SanA protein
VDYNEPGAMRAYAVHLGVPADAIVLDYAGRRTYDTCYRARAIFGVERAVLVTQRFHVARALYVCDALDVDAVALVADRRDYTVRRVIWETREYLALAQAWWDVNVRHPVPVLGEPLPIDLSLDRLSTTRVTMPSRRKLPPSGELVVRWRWW